MPSRKKVAQRARGKAQLCQSPKAEVLSLGAPLSSESLAIKEKVASQGPATEGSGQALYQHFAESFCGVTKAPSKDASPRSVSTHEDSALSGCSSSPLDSEASTVFSPQGSNRHAADLASIRISAPNAPLWVDNGLKGDSAAWLFVSPKPGMSCVPKSPKDAMLLGPYVTMRNTFLDETRVGNGVRFSQRRRSQSWSIRR